MNLHAIENYSPPDKYPDGELGRIVKLGEAILNNTSTHPLTKDFVGNSLTCKNCHLTGKNAKVGTSTGFGTLIATATVFPAYSKRSNAVITLQNRADECFVRSLNGTKPIDGSKISIAMAAYISWLSTGLPMNPNAVYPMSPMNIKIMQEKRVRFTTLQKNAKHSNFENGRDIFLKKCAVCHQKDGQGVGNFPALFGHNKNGKWLSYNSGAGMSKLVTSAIWIQSNMPLGEGNSLKDQGAADVALYVNAQPRADFMKSPHGDNNLTDVETVRRNFKDFRLNIDTIRGDNIIP